MTDDARIAEFLGWTRIPNGLYRLPGPVAWYREMVFDNSRDGWANLGELVAAIEAKGWAWSSDYARYELLAAYWADVRIGDRHYAGEADNLPEAVKNAVLAALEVEGEVSAA